MQTFLAFEAEAAAAAAATAAAVGDSRRPTVEEALVDRSCSGGRNCDTGSSLITLN